MQRNIFLFIFSLCFSSGLLFSQKSGIQDDGRMVREKNSLILIDTMSSAGDPLIILSNYRSEEVLVVVEDILGNEIYSKVVFRNQHAVLKAFDPYNRIPSGVYTVVAANRNELYQQKVVID
jgi:hypothetical protein